MDIDGGLAAKALSEEQGAGQAPSVHVYQVSNAGHLLMLDNWKEFNTGMVLSAGLEPDSDEHRPIKIASGQQVQKRNEMERIARRTANEPVAT
jgi:hypothetical protein